ncbi:MAG: hypothetical protein AAGN82_24915 [Myxococcota bacterium]
MTRPLPLLLTVVLLTASPLSAARGAEPGKGSMEKPSREPSRERGRKPGREPSKEACIAAYSEAQELRLEGQLVAARDALLICAAPACPQVARVDCSQWLTDTEAALPSVVPQLRGPAGDLVSSAKLYLDGDLRLERLDGSAFALDPGPHHFRFELPDGTSLEKEVVVVEGSKRQPVIVQLAPPPPVAAPVASVRPAPAAEEGPTLHPATWVLGAVAIAGFGVFAGLGGTSLRREGCRPTCTDEERDEIVTLRAGADVGLGVGVASLTAALIVGIVSATSDDATATATAGGVAPWVGPTSAGAGAWLRF